MPKFYNVCTRKTISEKGSERKIYHKVGVVKMTDKGWYLQLYHQPNTDFIIFPSHNETLPVIDFGKDEA